MPDRNTATRRGWAHAVIFLLLGLLGLIRTCFPLQITCLLHRASALKSDGARMATDTTRDLLATLSTNAAAIACSRRVVSTRRGSSQMRNVLRDGMLGADVGDTDVRSLSSLAECVVTRVKVFALLDSNKPAIRGFMDGFRGQSSWHTFSLFCRRSFLVGILP